MNRLFVTIHTDLRLQIRNGFYYAAAFVLGIYVLVLTQLPIAGVRLGWLLPALVVNNLMISSFYFVGGMVLLEKNDGTLTAQGVTPLRTGEYIWSKALTLTVLGMAYNGIIAGLLAGPRVALALMPGLAAASLFYCLFGLAAVAYYSSLNRYLMPSLLWIGLLTLPLVPDAMGWQHPLLYLHPLFALLLLLHAATEPVGAGLLLYAVVYAALWLAFAFWLARHRIAQAVVG